MKLVHILLLLIIPSTILYSQKNKSKNDPYKELGVNSINALVADQSYYAQSIVKYNVIREVINQFGSIKRINTANDNIEDVFNVKEKSILEAEDSISYIMKIEMEEFFRNNRSKILDIMKESEIYDNSEYYLKNRFSGSTIIYDETGKVIDVKNDTVYDFEKEKLKYLLTPDSVASFKYKTLPIMDCAYEIPTDIKNLKSGFQFNHYAFDSRNNSALQAFGIANSNYSKTTYFVIIDYIQFLDCNCGTLPKIRYAIGLRAQLRIEDRGVEAGLGEIPSLPKLAASVENSQNKVDISIRTIGITGIPARYNIPSNTSFNVETYHDYQNVIDFIKSLEDTTTFAPVRQQGIRFHPELIPILDDYKISLEESFEPIYQSFGELEIKIKKFKYKKWFMGRKGGVLILKQHRNYPTSGMLKKLRTKWWKSRSEKVMVHNSIVNLLNQSSNQKNQMLSNQIDFLVARRNQEFESTKLLNNYSRFITLLTYLRGLRKE